MIIDITGVLVTRLTADFSNDIQAIATAKGVTLLDATVNIYPRLIGAYILDPTNGLPLPGLGIYPIRALSNAKTQHARKTLATMALDYVLQEVAQDAIFQQLELAVEAIMKTVDRIDQGGEANGVYGAGDAERSVEIQFLPPSKLPEGESVMNGRVIVRVPVWQQDSGL